MVAWTDFAVEIRIPGEPTRVGSGYLIGSCKVLTALHVVMESWKADQAITPPDCIQVRAYGDYVAAFGHLFGSDADAAFNKIAEAAQGDFRWRDAVLVWPAPDSIALGVDLAILKVLAPESESLLCADPAIACVQPDSDSRCRCFGFPNWTWSKTESGVAFSRPIQADGVLTHGAATINLTRDLTVTSAAPAQDEDWKGLSGAALFAAEPNGLLGVVTKAFTSATNNFLQIILLADVADRVGTFWDVSGLRRPTSEREEMLECWRKYEFDTLGQLSAQIEQRPLDLVVSPLAELWSSYVDTPPWHDRLRKDLDIVKDAAAAYPKILSGLAQRVGGVDMGAIYSTLQYQLKGFQDSAVEVELRQLAAALKAGSSEQGSERDDEAPVVRRLRGVLEHLQREWRDPHFGRCFFVLGGLGSGKTHFIAWLLADHKEHQDRRRDHMLLVLSEPHGASEIDETKFEELIVKAIRKATGSPRWSSLAQFTRFMASGSTAPSHVAPESSPPARLIIVIDGLERWLAAVPSFMEVLAAFIQNRSNEASVYWLITLNTYDYDKVSAGRTMIQFCESYGFNRHYRVRRRKVFEHSSLQIEFSEIPDPAIGGWLSLEDLNRSSGLGVELLRAALRQGGNEVSETFKMLEENATANRHFEIPFVVWVFLDARDQEQLSLDVLATVNFIAFVKLFWEKTSRALIAMATEKLATFAALARPDDLLERGATLFADWLTNSARVAAVFDEFVDEIAKAAEARGDVLLKRQEVVACVLNLLEHGNLVRRVRSNDSLDDWKVDRLEFSLQVFWDYKQARQLLAQIRRSGHGDDAVAAQKDLEQIRGDRSFSESVLEFLLLIIDDRQIREERLFRPEFLSSLCQTILASDKMPAAAIWFSGAKASPDLQRSLIELANSRPVATERRTLFAFVNFVGAIAKNVATPPARLALVRPAYKAIGECELGGYLVHIVDKVLEEAKHDEDSLLGCMRQLQGSEQTGHAEDLSFGTVDALTTCMQGDINEMIRFLTRAYLKDCSKQAELDYQQRRGIKWERHFYREWVLQKFCRQIVGAAGRYEDFKKTYALLAKHYWFSPRHHGIGNRIGLEMAREANIAFGSRYRYGRTPEFVRFVQGLAVSKYTIDRRNAVFIIKHTEWTHGEDAVRVDNVFHPILEALLVDAEIASTVKHNLPLFRRNLD